MFASCIPLCAFVSYVFVWKERIREDTFGFSRYEKDDSIHNYILEHVEGKSKNAK